MIRTSTIALLLLAAAACGGYPPRETVAGWSLDPRSLPAPEGWRDVLERARAAAPCPLVPEVWGGVALYAPVGAYGASADVPTWYPGDVPRIGVELTSALAVDTATGHAACHVAQMLCGLDPYQHDAAFWACVAGADAP
jgi:hypothetical protein